MAPKRGKGGRTKHHNRGAAQDVEMENLGDVVDIQHESTSYVDGNGNEGLHQAQIDGTEVAAAEHEMVQNAVDPIPDAITTQELELQYIQQSQGVQGVIAEQSRADLKRAITERQDMSALEFADRLNKIGGTNVAIGQLGDDQESFPQAKQDPMFDETFELTAPEQSMAERIESRMETDPDFRKATAEIDDLIDRAYKTPNPSKDLMEEYHRQIREIEHDMDSDLRSGGGPIP